MTIDKLYAYLYERQVFTLDEAVEAAERLTRKALSKSHVSSKHINPLMKSLRLARADTVSAWSSHPAASSQSTSSSLHRRSGRKVS